MGHEGQGQGFLRGLQNLTRAMRNKNKLSSSKLSLRPGDCITPLKDTEKGGGQECLSPPPAVSVMHLCYLQTEKRYKIKRVDIFLILCCSGILLDAALFYTKLVFS